MWWSDSRHSEPSLPPSPLDNFHEIFVTSNIRNFFQFPFACLVNKTNCNTKGRSIKQKYALNKNYAMLRIPWREMNRNDKDTSILVVSTFSLQPLRMKSDPGSETWWCLLRDRVRWLSFGWRPLPSPRPRRYRRGMSARRVLTARRMTITTYLFLLLLLLLLLLFPPPPPPSSFLLPPSSSSHLLPSSFFLLLLFFCLFYHSQLSWFTNTLNEVVINSIFSVSPAKS